MGREELVETIEAFFEAMNDHHVEKMGQFCTQEVIADEVAEPEPFTGVDAFKESYSEVFEGYPNCVAEIQETFVDGDSVICQVRWHATNSGIFRGEQPTGKKVDLRIAYFFKLRDGKIHRITEYYDLATLLAQQGQLDL